MSSVYDRFRSTATRMMARYGLPASISRTTTPALSLAARAAGIMPTAQAQVIPCRAILNPATTKNADGTITTSLSATVDTTVLVNDTLTMGTKTYTVTAVEENNPDAGTGIFYTVDLR